MLYQAINESGIEDGLEYALYMKDVIEKLGKQLSSLRTNLLNASKPPRKAECCFGKNQVLSR